MGIAQIRASASVLANRWSSASVTVPVVQNSFFMECLKYVLHLDNVFFSLSSPLAARIQFQVSVLQEIYYMSPNDIACLALKSTFRLEVSEHCYFLEQGCSKCKTMCEAFSMLFAFSPPV